MMTVVMLPRGRHCCHRVAFAAAAVVVRVAAVLTLLLLQSPPWGRSSALRAMGWGFPSGNLPLALLDSYELKSRKGTSHPKKKLMDIFLMTNDIEELLAAVVDSQSNGNSARLDAR